LEPFLSFIWSPTAVVWVVVACVCFGVLAKARLLESVTCDKAERNAPRAAHADDADLADENIREWAETQRDELPAIRFGKKRRGMSRQASNGPPGNASKKLAGEMRSKRSSKKDDSERAGTAGIGKRKCGAKGTKDVNSQEEKLLHQEDGTGEMD